MHEISPVLAGTFDRSDYTPTVGTFNQVANSASTDTTTSTSVVTDTVNTSSTQSIDPRRYTKFDRTASQVADAPDFSFGDFLDLVNPLQHIPVVSALYRSATGDNINPVSRVAGDILYGGALGAISAVVGGVTAISDAVTESKTGHDTKGAVLASLFGDDDKTTTQVAASDSTNANDANALAALSAPQLTSQSVPKTADQTLLASAASGSTPAVSAAVEAVTPAPLASADSTAPTLQGKAFPLTKQAFGGVMAPVNDIENQNRIIALSQGSHAMRLGNTIYTSRFMNGPHPLPVANPPAATSTTSTDTAAATTTAEATSTTAMTAPSASATTSALMAGASMAGNGANTSGQRNPLPQNLIDDMVMMKAIGQYKGVASGQSSLGSALDISN